MCLKPLARARFLVQKTANNKQAESAGHAFSATKNKIVIKSCSSCGKTIGYRRQSTIIPAWPQQKHFKDSKFWIPSFSLQASDSQFQIASFRFQVFGFNVLDSMRQICIFRFQCLDFKFQIQCFRFRIWDFKLQIPNLKSHSLWFWISDFKCQISNFRFRIPRFRFRVSDCKFQISNCRCQASDFKFQSPGFREVATATSA